VSNIILYNWYGLAPLDGDRNGIQLEKVQLQPLSTVHILESGLTQSNSGKLAG